jgi:hypothetical protein
MGEHTLGSTIASLMRPGLAKHGSTEFGHTLVFDYGQLRKEHGFGPGDGGPKHGGKNAARSQRVGSKGETELRGSGCSAVCHKMPKLLDGDRADSGVTRPQLLGSGCYAGRHQR